MVRFGYREKPNKTVQILWREADPALLQINKALYMYRTLRGRTILLIGKAGRETIRQRWTCPSKDRVNRLAKKEGIKHVRPFIGILFTVLPITHSLVHDVEKLLIFHVQPRWNQTGKQSYTMARPNLTVERRGWWPHREWSFQHPPPRSIGTPGTCVIEIPCIFHTKS